MGLESALTQSLREARAAGTRLARIVYPIDLTDPWSLLSKLCVPSHRVMAWSAPKSRDGAPVFVAVGAAIELRPQGQERFQASKDWWSDLRSTMKQFDGLTGEAIAIDAPACLAGFAFSHSEHRSDKWAPWGDGALCVPEILIWKQGKSCVAVLSSVLDDGAVERLQSLVDQVQGWCQRSSPPRTPSPQHSGAIIGTEIPWDDWRDRVQAARTQMASGHMDKVVLARAQSFVAAPECHFDVAATAKALRDRQTEATTFLVQRTDGQAFLGSTPEILVRLTGRTVETVAMAGTRKRGMLSESDALSRDLFASPKDRHEQALVTEAVRRALAPVVENLQVPEAPDVVQLPDVQHLRTPITGTLLNGVELFGLLDRLHPTPAVGGLPRTEALAWLDDHEGLDRGWYAGPIGWTNQAGDGAFVVAIRSALMTEREAAAFAGCGVVAHSNPRDEWDESVVKLQTVRSGLTLRANSAQDRNKT